MNYFRSTVLNNKHLHCPGLVSAMPLAIPKLLSKDNTSPILHPHVIRDSVH